MSDQDNTNTPVEPIPPVSDVDNAMPVMPEPMADKTPLVWEAPASTTPLTAAPNYWGTPPPPAETNAWAIVSLVASILSWVGLFGIGGIVGLIAGIIGRNQIRDSAGRQTGDGLAIAGIVLGGVNVVLSCIAILCMLVVFAGLFTMPFMYNGR